MQIKSGGIRLSFLRTCLVTLGMSGKPLSQFLHFKIKHEFSLEL